MCSQHCTSPTSVSATFKDVPDGYHPIRLEIHWKLSAVVALYGAGDTSLVKGMAEYSLNSGGSWTTLEEFSWTGASPACTLRVSNNGGQIWVYDVRVIADPCPIPIDESSAAVGWESTAPFRTAHNFLQTLTPAGSVSFSGRKILEADGGGTQDGCYFQGSSIPEVTETVSGGLWTVGSNNTWGSPTDPSHYDTVGWAEEAVDYYQGSSQASKPCFLQGLQIMFISCNTTYLPYITNTLKSGIDTSSVSAERQNSFAQRSRP